MLPEIVCNLLQRDFHDFYASDIILLLLIFHNFLETRGYFILKMDIPTVVILMFMIDLHDNVPN